MKKSRTVVPPAAVESPRHLPLVDVLVDARIELFELAIRSGLKVTPSDYSPNGRLLAFLPFERGAPRVAVLDRHTKEVTIQHRGVEVQFHPGGEWLTFVVPGDVFLDRVGGGGPRIRHPSSSSAR